MGFGIKLMILAVMLWLHIVDDYYLQGILAKLKQKQWWQENTSNKLYKDDYKIALIEHAFSWAFVIMIPVAACILMKYINAHPITYIIMLISNTLIHAYIDNEKANKHTINLILDQSVHFYQIIITWLVFFIIL